MVLQWKFRWKFLSKYCSRKDSSAPCLKSQQWFKKCQRVFITKNKEWNTAITSDNMSKVQTLLKCVLKLFAWHRVCFSTIWMWLFLVTVSYWRTESWHIFRIVPISDSNLNSNIILNVNSTLFSYVSFSYVFFSDGIVIFGNECVSIAKHVKSAML